MLIPLVTIVERIATPRHTRLSVFANAINHYIVQLCSFFHVVKGTRRDGWLMRKLSRSQQESGVLDGSSIVFFLAIGTPFKNIIPCLLDLPSILRTRCVLERICVKMGAMRVGGLIRRGVVSSHFLAKVDPSFAKEFGPLLMQVLSQGWDAVVDYNERTAPEASFRQFDPDIPHILMFLWQIAKVDGELKCGQDPDNQEDIHASLIEQLGDVC